MSDKMMRMASRGEDGLAKALRSGSDGELITMNGGTMGEDITIFDKISASAWSSAIDVSKYSSAIIRVSGLTTGRIDPKVTIGGTNLDWIVVNQLTDEVRYSIVEPGIYSMDLTGINFIIMRALYVESDEEITITATLSTEKMERRVVATPSTRIVEIDKYYGDVEPGLNYIFKTIDTSRFAYYFVQIIQPGEWTILEQQMEKPSRAFSGRSTFFSGSSRGVSDWQEVRSRLTSVIIDNESGETQSAAIVLCGVR